MNISAHIDFYKQEMQRRGLANSTVQSYPSYVRTFFEQSKADHPKNIHEQEIREFLGRFTEPNTQRAYHSAIKKFYAICLNQEHKFRYIPYCKQSKKLPIVLSVEEIQRMFDVCDNLKHRAILALLYSCSFRSSELINLKWTDIDHCSATHMLESGVDLNLIQRILGHSSVKTTAIYAHISHNLISKVQSPLSQISL